VFDSGQMSTAFSVKSNKNTLAYNVTVSITAVKNYITGTRKFLADLKS